MTSCAQCGRRKITMNNQTSPDEIVQYIYADRIVDPVDAMRSGLDRETLHDLSTDIQKNGLINPITVRPLGENFEVVAGHRRFTACKWAGMVKIPCIVRDLNDDQVFSVKTAENLKRDDVDPVDEGMHYLVAINKLGKSIAEIADMVGRSTQYVKDRVTVAEMPDYMKVFIKSGQLKLGAALLLMEIEPDEKRQLWVGIAVERNVSIREVDYWLYQHKLGTLPTSVVEGGDVPGAPPGAPKVILFRCSLDGKEYPITDTTMITVAKCNLGYVAAMGEELRRVGAENPPHEKEEPAHTPVGVGAH